METSLDAALVARLTASASAVGSPGPAPWQPVHTVYGGAQRFTADVAAKIGRHARTLLDGLAPTLDGFRALPWGFDAPPSDAALEAVLVALHRKLSTAPVEDYRIDFEDGFGPRSDADEDAAVVSAASALADALRDGTAPRGVGFRVKAFGPETAARGLRTLDGFLTGLARRRDGASVPGLVVALPKVGGADEVARLVEAIAAVERALGGTEGSVGVELMLETPRSVLAADGTVALPGLLRAASGRCVAVHLGAWDLTASLGVGADAASLLHPHCDFARSVAQFALAGTGVRLVDGATGTLPVDVHRGGALTAAQRSENRASVVAALGVMTRHWRHATAMGLHQGWDLHPGQVLWRHALVIAHARARFAGTAARLKSFLAQGAAAVRDGAVFDDAATAQGLVNDVLRALDAGAVTEDDVSTALGVPPTALRTRSFAVMIGR